MSIPAFGVTYGTTGLLVARRGDRAPPYEPAAEAPVSLGGVLQPEPLHLRVDGAGARALPDSDQLGQRSPARERDRALERARRALPVAPHPRGRCSKDRRRRPGPRSPE